MKQVKVVFIAVWCFIGAGLNVLIGGDTIRLRLPLHMSDGSNGFEPLTKTDVKLLINGRSREIVDLVKQEKSIAGTPGLGRSFILSFHIDEYNKKIADGVSYFVSDVLDVSDLLFILTPLKVYRVQVSRNKLKIIKNIETLVKKDCNRYNENRQRLEKDLERAIDDLQRNLQHANPGRGPYSATFHFFKFFPAQFVQFNDFYWKPDIEKYRQVIDFLGVREGERWCIHFQQRNIYSLFFKTKQLLRRLKEYFSRVGDTSHLVKVNFDMFARKLSQVNSYPAQPLLETILGAHIHFNSILYGGMDQKKTTGGGSESFYLERILRQTSIKSGGKAVETAGITDGLQEIVRHKDHYYDLLFDFNGKIEEKKIQVILEGTKTKPGFKEKFALEEMKALIRHFSAEKVKIEGVSLAPDKKNKRLVSFVIKSFELGEQEQEEKFGILRVRIQLHHKKEGQVYNSQRMLRVTKDVVGISHTLPRKYNGQFVLIISVTDLIRNSSASFSGEIKI